MKKEYECYAIKYSWFNQLITSCLLVRKVVFTVNLQESVWQDNSGSYLESEMTGQQQAGSQMDAASQRNSAIMSGECKPLLINISGIDLYYFFFWSKVEIRTIYPLNKLICLILEKKILDAHLCSLYFDGFVRMYRSLKVTCIIVNNFYLAFLLLR